jgi:glycosyltransferase involved in cell wall biosynthesis
MKILFLSDFFYPRYGGAELATYLYSKRLAENNHDVVVVTHRYPAEPAARALLHGYDACGPKKKTTVFNGIRGVIYGV